eukprot:TRINITY_DN18632_c0_g1_i1.p1 TRINITY_DN18632_c0_g1~~TRINITY_DN18632_c0_g1_i1.p1  ORF type:complete len:634 (-),score=104.87 TRINITY_DN18632_c0_g1_i1:166-2067(-)
MARVNEGPSPDCPPCSADALLPVCRALAVAGSWAGADSFGGLVGDESVPAHAEIFSTRRPRDAIAGSVSASKTVLRSCAAGAATLLMAPSEASRRDGTSGFLVGMGQSMVTAAMLPCCGVAVAAVQVARGLANTPVAVVESFRGYHWSDKDRTWGYEEYTLKEEARELRRRQKEGEAEAARARAKSRCAGRRRRPSTNDGSCGTTSAGGVATPVDCATGSSDSSSMAGRQAVGAGQRQEQKVLNYYELLQIPRDATETAIRQAYYRQSRRCHPDKAGADSASVAQFHKISEAYCVLRNPDLRRAYDRGGAPEVARVATTINLGSLYVAVISGPQWEPFLGPLALSRILSEDEGDTNGRSLDLLVDLWRVGDTAVDPWQARREVRCALQLSDRLRPFVNGRASAFESLLREEARTLARAPFASGVLQSIASVYEDEASFFLGGLRLLDPRRELARISSHGRIVACQARAVKAGVLAAFALKDLMGDDEGSSAGGNTDDASSRPSGSSRSSMGLECPAFQAEWPAFASALWTLTVLDVEGTLRRVCRRVLRDGSTDLASRTRRAEALRVAAAIFREAADERLAAEPQLAGIPGEDEPVLRNRVQDMAAKLANEQARGGGTSGSCAWTDDDSDGSA